MELRIPRAAVAAIASHARETYPEECCGFLIGSDDPNAWTVTSTRRARNVHPEGRRTRYTIDPKDVLAVEREGRGSEARLLGFYHSHPDYPPTPSAYDTERAWPRYVYAILETAQGGTGEFRAWTFDAAAGAFQEARVSVVG